MKAEKERHDQKISDLSSNASKKRREESSSQPTLGQVLSRAEKYGENSGQQQAFDTAMVDMMACTGTSFNWVEHPKTKKLFDVSNPKFTVKHRTTYSRQMTSRADGVMQRVNKIISDQVSAKEILSVSYTTDNWTSRANSPFMSLSLHYIDSEWDLQSWCLRVAPCPGRLTAVNLRLKLSDMIDRDLIPDSVDKFVINDNAHNIVLAVEEMDGVEEERCMCHTLQLAINDTFKEVDGMTICLRVCKGIATYVHQSPVAEKALKDVAIEIGQDYVKPQNSNDTRWHSELICMESIVKNKIALITIANKSGDDDDLKDICDNFNSKIPNAQQWQLIEGAVTILQPFLELGRIWEADKVPTCNRVIDCLYDKLAQLKKWYISSSNRRSGVMFTKTLERNLKLRFPDCNAGKFIYAAGNYLDPVFKGIHLKAFNGDHFDDTKEQLEQLASRKKLIDEDTEDNADPEALDMTLSPTSKLKQKYKHPIHNVQFGSPFQRECQLYETSKDANKGCDRLLWWKVNEKSYPILSKLAKYILAIPASSATSERIFSAGGIIVNDLRCLLDDEKVEDILKIRLNIFKVEKAESKLLV